MSRSTIKAAGLAMLFFLLLVSAPLPLRSPAAAEEPKRVLLLFSEDQSLPLISVLNQSIRSTFNRTVAGRIEFYTEYLDRARITDEIYERELINFWRKKYEERKVDLIIVGISSALDLLERHPADLFPGVPVVYCVHFEQQISGIKNRPDVTGVWSAPPFRPTLELALRLHPDTRRVLLYSGSGEFDRGVLAIAKAELRDFDTGGVALEYLSEVTLGELQERLASLPKQTIVIQISFTTDKAGVVRTGMEVASKAASASTAPVYGLSRNPFGSGIVGGSLINTEDIGARAAEIGARILAGERAQDIAPQSVPTVLMFDWRELRRWGISEKNLPHGSIVQFRVPTIWDEYKWRIIVLISLIIAQTALIGGLLITRERRKQAIEQLCESQERYGLATKAGSTGVWDWDLKTKAIYVDPLLKSILGYEDHEIRNHIDDWVRFTHPEDVAQVMERTQAYIDGETPFLVVERRMLHKDGSVRWFLARGNVVRNRKGKVVRLLGTDTDITESKRADDALRQSEFRNRAMLTALPDLIFLLSRDGVYLDYHAREPGELFAHPESFIGRNMREVLPPELAAAFERCIEQTLLSNEPVILDYSLPKGKEEHYYESSMVNVDGARVMCIVRDITRRKQAEQSLQRVLNEVRELKDQLRAENIYLQEEIKLSHNFEEIIGNSDALKYVLFKVEQVAAADTAVLIQGETGTGKELIARAIHHSSPRRDRPLVKVNCAALPANLIESELFGHEKGAFTGAAARKPGRFELAKGGTLFLDEIGELPLELQPKLLRALQEGEFERVGGTQTIKADVRVIAATNRDLKVEVQRRLFREDLWYRLNVFPLSLPPLRQRRDDIPLLVNHFINIFSKKLGKRIQSVAPATMKALQEYAWPGNIRELANVIERAVINLQGPVLQLADKLEPAQSAHPNGRMSLLEIEREIISQRLVESEWKIEGPRGAAKSLGLNPSTLRLRMEKLGIQRPESHK